MNQGPTSSRSSQSGKKGFTLVELLLSMGVLAILMLLIVQVIGQTSDVWRNTTAKADQFREARDAFEAISRNLSQATLNTYYDYFDASGNRRTAANASTFVPSRYGRHSELRFQTGPASTLIGGAASTRPTHAIFFQAPLGFNSEPENAGLDNLLNTWGYFLEFRPDTDRPAFVPGVTRSRFRLMEYRQPSEELNIYESPAEWIDSVEGSEWARVVASNIVAMVILPKLPSKGAVGDPTVDPDGNKLAPLYAYDSTLVGQGASNPELNSLHQLPPVVEFTMVAIDEASASQLDLENGSSPPNFGLSAMFQNASPEARRADLESLVGNLTASGVSYRVFSTEISIRGAKWSREQTVVASSP
ncbi:Verru_Chthon cassette protein C [Phragmitibacter flavus]|uniref:Verru_Chthon cassette protein C n=1 Tax=Phragmitibacter flavus TaxID=2576071 RepID=A0A5R8KF91_9BACT|nr:Verru_Chthon cassette protein C [Phragmitibacter flavus]TLD70966.1 Verru_Chthon cassette protein C [Phragmitibacter flavus]